MASRLRTFYIRAAIHGVCAVSSLYVRALSHCPCVLFGLQTCAKGGGAVIAEARSTMGGFYLGLGLAALLLAQPMIYLALGAAFALAAFARILSMLSDSGNTARELVLAGCSNRCFRRCPSAYVFGFCLRRDYAGAGGFVQLIPPFLRFCRQKMHAKGAFGLYACCESRYPMLDEPRLVGRNRPPGLCSSQRNSNKFKVLGLRFPADIVLGLKSEKLVPVADTSQLISGVAERYASSLFDLALEAGSVESVWVDLDQFQAHDR